MLASPQPDLKAKPLDQLLERLPFQLHQLHQLQFQLQFRPQSQPHHQLLAQLVELQPGRKLKFQFLND